MKTKLGLLILGIAVGIILCDIFPPAKANGIDELFQRWQQASASCYKSGLIEGTERANGGIQNTEIYNSVISMRKACFVVGLK